jgi:hypothetical protein
MGNLRKCAIKLFIPILAAIVLVTPAQADEGANRQTTQQVNQNKVQGLKGAALAKALQSMAKVLRIGAKSDLFQKMCKEMATDKRALQVFTKHAGKIAGVLDDIARMPDLVLGVVGQQLFHLLTTDRGPIKMDHGAAKVIEKIVVGTLSVAVF